MSNATFSKRMDEVRLNEGLLNLWDIIDSFAPRMYYYDPCYECNVVSAEFLARLPEFRKWAKARGLRWFRTWEERENWLNS